MPSCTLRTRASHGLFAAASLSAVATATVYCSSAASPDTDGADGGRGGADGSLFLGDGGGGGRSTGGDGGSSEGDGGDDEEARDASDASDSGDAGAPPEDADSAAPIVPAFYVSPTGSDANAGTLAQPFATLGKAQSAMQASSAIKTTYIRAGSYRLPDAGLTLGAADNGETWSYYPPDGVDSASLSGGSTAKGTGVNVAISVANTDHVTIEGLTIQDFQYAGIGSGGGTKNLLVENNVLFNGYTASGSSNPAGISCYGCANTTIAHNVIHDIAQFGVSVSNVNGDISNLLVTGNVSYDTCTAIADCGSLYVQDVTATATNIRLTNNYVHDGNTFASLGSGYGSALYADDCTSNVVESGNVLSGRNGANTTLVHGGSNVHQTGNLTDLASYGQRIATFQTSSVSGCESATMSGNEYENNVVIGAGGGGYALLSGSPKHTPTIVNNDYFSYTGGTISSGSGSYADTAPAHVDPELTGWAYAMSPASPVVASPVSFAPLVGGWGPPGYVVPQTGTPPSSPH